MKRTTQHTILFTLLALALGLSTAWASDYVTFSYTGLVRVQGHAYTGQGQFKLAIVNLTGNTTLWSNDGTSVDGGEPSSAIAATVENGIFNVQVGDVGAGMDPINRIIFNHPSRIKLRIWFDDGFHGFQRLLPDRPLHNIEVLALRTGDEDFTIYVDGATGNDENNGLTTDTAKQTIQAAVDVLPGRINSNVTIRVFPGIYRETVTIHGISVHPDKSFRLVGNEDWVRDVATSPTVRITGCDDDQTKDPVRKTGIRVASSSNVTIEGFLVDYGTWTGILLSHSDSIYVRRCKVVGFVYGVTDTNGEAHLTEVVSMYNGGHGFFWHENGSGTVSSCIAQENAGSGYILSGACHARLSDCQARDNGDNGVFINLNAVIVFFGNTRLTGNGWYGLRVSGNSIAMTWWDSIDFSGNYFGTFDVDGSSHIQ